MSKTRRANPPGLSASSLASWGYGMINDFKQGQALGQDQLRRRSINAMLPLWLDPSQLTQVIWNRAQRHSLELCQPDQPADITLRIRQPNPTQGALVEVIDRGPGHRHPNQRQLFEPFFTTRADDLVGLYICKQLLGANQGSIEYIPCPVVAAVFASSCWRCAAAGR